MADHRSCPVVQPAQPLVQTDTDFAGPFKGTITRGRSMRSTKAYVCLLESVMNTRPLCRTLSSDPSELLALTPAHFLNITPLKYLPAREIYDNLHTLSRHDLLDKLVQSFWKRWRTSYLHTLQSRRKWNTPVDPITVGTVVVILTENSPPLHWPLGIVEEVFPGSNGVTRIVRVRTAIGSYLRPVVRLIPLPNQ
ncbi:putative bel12 ag transposon polyprotein [Operophtera brumata]|uniref:Putative bel12 ag transposon polyprotein n=1 Tax=Operophtera brumata TaxID=104452 RepID=A0A0L7KVB8_OPEBR|nr:putative bel12 ag transposon polyprotein [Operophtera brumata]